MPDVWQPLRAMTENLLPHLHFEKIDVTDRDHVKCLWTVHGKNIRVDIDDLSSGEKAIIQLFFPLIENRIQARIDQAAHSAGDEADHRATEQVCVLLDEPELHLHPNLQGKVVDYLRGLAEKENVQFILATHSPTIVENGTSDELFLLKPSEAVGPEENQLIRIASDNEKLDLMRDIFGSISNLTAMRTILVVEGRKADRDSKRATDERIFNFLGQRFAQVTILAGGSKQQCVVLAESLAEIFANDLSSRVGSYALVDRDLGQERPEDARVRQLPVSMIENLLVDPEVIWKAIVTVRHKTRFERSADVEAGLERILDDLRGREIERRIKVGVGYFSFRARDPVEAIGEQARVHISKVEEATSETRTSELRQQAEAKVQQLLDEQSRRENYSGKEILASFYREYLHGTGMSKEIFIYECAQAAAERATVRRFVDDLFSSI